MAERLSLTDLSSLDISPRDRLRAVTEMKERLTVTHSVGLDEIEIDRDVIVDVHHAQELAKVILHGKWGQTAPFLLRAKVHQNGNKEIIYDIADAMHRISGLKSELGTNSNHVISAAVMYGCSNAEFIEHRILAANNVESIRFARLGRWFNMAWAETPWANLLSAKTAFGITTGDSSGRNSDLTRSDVVQIKNWVHTNTTAWRTRVDTAYQILKIHEVADPELVLKVRGGSFVRGQLALTQTQIGIIALNLPGKKNFEIQKAVATHATSLSLSTEEIQSMVNEILTQGLTKIKDVKDLIDSKNWKHSRTSRQGVRGAGVLTSIEQAMASLNKSPLNADERDQAFDTLFKVYKSVELAISDEYKTALPLLETWLLNASNRQDLRKNYEAKDSFFQQTKDLSLKTQEVLATLALQQLGSRDSSVREGISDFIGLLPLRELDGRQMTSLFSTIDSVLSEINSGYYERDLLSSIVESSLDVLSVLSKIKDGSEVIKGWTALIKKVEKISLNCDIDCQNSVKAWIESQREK